MHERDKSVRHASDQHRVLRGGGWHPSIPSTSCGGHWRWSRVKGFPSDGSLSGTRTSTRGRMTWRFVAHARPLGSCAGCEWRSFNRPVGAVGGCVDAQLFGEQPVEFFADGDVLSDRQRVHAKTPQKRRLRADELGAPACRCFGTVAGEPLQAIARGVDQDVDMAGTEILFVRFDGLAVETFRVPVRICFLPSHEGSVPCGQMRCNGCQQRLGYELEPWLEATLP